MSSARSKIDNHSIQEKDCITAVTNALGTSDFVLESYDVEAASDSPIGFMARHLILTAKVKVGGKLENLRFFCKSPPASEGHRSFVVDLEYFQKEIIMYENFVPVMSKELPSRVTMPIPRCYLTRGNRITDSNQDPLVIMEDVTQRNYVTPDKTVPFDLSHCRQVMKCLAQFHSPSFLILRSESSSKGRRLLEDMFLSARENLLVRERQNMGYKWAKNSIRTMVTAAAAFWPDKFSTEKSRKLLSERLRESWLELYKIAKPSGKYTNVLCHGDMWANNIMFRYSSGKNRVPEEVILVDLQLIRLVPPAFDLLLFFHTSTTREFREKYLLELLTEYHRSLEEIITKDVLDNLMPMSSLLESMEEFKMFGIIISTAYLPLILNDEDTVPLMGENGEKAGEPPNFMELIENDHGKNVLLNAEVNQMYKKRVKDSFQECLEFIGLVS